MEFMDRAISLLNRHEGCKLKPYRCTAGKLTIGIGRNLDDVGISEEEANYLLNNDIKKCLIKLEKLNYWPVLTETRRLVLLDMAFNLGYNGLMGFKKFLGAVSDRRYEEASRLMLDSKWAKQVGQRAVTLSAMMKQG
jgi:lysozyme